MNKRFIVSLVLMLLILAGYFVFYAQKTPSKTPVTLKLERNRFGYYLCGPTLYGDSKKDRCFGNRNCCEGLEKSPVTINKYIHE